MLMLGSLCWLLALILETSAVLALWQHHSALFLLCHATSTLLVSIAILQQLPKEWKTSFKSLLFSVGCFNFFVPAVGIIGLFILTSTRYFQKDIDLAKPILFVSPPSDVVQEVVGSQFGVGGAIKRLISNKSSIQKRTEALLALSVLQSAEKNSLMRKILNDDTDQLRLLAFSLLDQQEKKISARISILRERYTNTTTRIERGQIAHQLAEQYWELIFKDLVQGDLRNTILRLALDYANVAWTTLEGDAKLAVLLSRCHLANDDIQTAEVVLNCARKKGARSTQVLPYLATIHYINRDFKQLRQTLLANPHLRDIPKLKCVVEFWCNKHE